MCEDIPKRNKWPCDVIDGIDGDDEAEAKEKALPLGSGMPIMKG
jgi:hypothetical protein